MNIKKFLGLILIAGLVWWIWPGSPHAGFGDRSSELTRLADKYESDKGSGYHGYTEVYELFLRPIKYEARKICEIGILEGASLKMFRDYFPDAVIYGIDIADCSRLDSNRIKTFVADQANRSQLGQFINKFGADYDLILDDGGHLMEQQQTSLGVLFRSVKRGGWYILEDLHTSIYKKHGSGYGAEPNEGNTTLTMINNFLRTGSIESRYMTDEEKNYLSDHIGFCHLSGGRQGGSITCILKKK